MFSGVSADFHKWVDEDGQVHYGDCPPSECESQVVEIVSPPSAKEVERAQQRLEHYQQLLQQYRAERGTTAKPSARQELIPQKLPCFDPLTNLISGPSSELYAPITPTILNKQQQRYLKGIFHRLDSTWRKGVVKIINCKETPSCGASESNCEDQAVQIEVDTIGSGNRLQIKLQWHDELQHKRDYRYMNFEVGERLYYSGNLHVQQMKLPGNSVELLHLDKQSLLFLVKPRIRGVKGRIPYPEIRYLTISDTKWNLIELRYIQNRLHERRDWRFSKSRN